MKEKAIFSWSGGKDSAMALYELSKNEKYQIAALLTTVTEDYDRISMHGIRRTLLKQQAKSLGLALEEVFISKDDSDEGYESKMQAVLEKYMRNGVKSAAFGDIFLEDLRKYRENNLLKVEMNAIFPIWKQDTGELARRFISNGFKAVITCVDSKVIDKSFVGRNFDQQFLSDLPADVDRCGENGEFHSFVYDGPIFCQPIPHVTGEVVLRDDRFYFCDVKPT